MTRRRSVPIDIPGLDVPRAKRYSRIKLGLYAASTLLGAARALWLADERRARRVQQAVAAAVPDQRLARPAFLAVVTGFS